jgi:hypothetical protein
MGQHQSTRSKLEYLVQNWLDELFPEPTCHYISNGYYSWIRSPKGYPLQLDFLVYSKHKMIFAIEVEGKQHYEKLYYQTEKEHTYLRDCDILKMRALNVIGVPLVKMKDREEGYTKETFIELLSKYNIDPTLLKQ